MEVTKHFCSFAEAVRSGATLRPQAFNHTMLRGRSCVWGAGLEALGLIDEDVFSTNWSLVDRTEVIYPYLKNRAQCPVTGCDDPLLADVTKLSVMLIHLNDFHRWSREAIADFLEAEEEKLGFVLISDEVSEQVQDNSVRHENSFLDRGLAEASH